MERFEIEDIVRQDKTGIVYHAVVCESGADVAVRRFFPHGRNHDGLGPEEAAAHITAVERLAEIRHPALRAIISGGTDPVDGIPFLVTEWVEGAHLTSVMEEQTLDPGLVIDVLRLALELSVVVSHVLGEEAVWVETDIETIEVGSRGSGRGFTFWISPLKWLGINPGSKRLISLCELGRELTGWNHRAVADHEGYGLAGWLRWLDGNPDVSLQEALEKLAESTGNEPPQPEEDIVRRSIVPAKRPAGTKAKAAVLSCVAAALAVTAGLLVYPLMRSHSSPREKADEVILSPQPPAAAAEARRNEKSSASENSDPSGEVRRGNPEREDP